jgi:hypothetical protein
MWRARVEADADQIVRLLRRLAPRQDLATAHGIPAPWVSPNQWVRRLSAEVHGSNRTLLEQDLVALPFDVDDAPLPRGSALDQGQNLYAAAEYARETFLPPGFRDVDLAISASSSTGFKPGRVSLHAYVILDRSVPMPVAYKYVAGAKAARFPLDPRPLLPNQLFLTGRPRLWGLDDPVPQSLWAFVLPGQCRRVSAIDWNDFEPQRVVREATERRADSVCAGLGWRAVLANFLGDSEGQLGFFVPLSMALGHAARSGEDADAIVNVMHTIIGGHRDLNPERAGHYTLHWLRAELNRMRAKDAARALTSPQTTLFAGALTMIEGCLNAKPPLVTRAKRLVAQEGDPVVRSHLACRLAAKLAHRSLTNDALDVLGLIDGVRPATAPEWLSRYGRRS